MIAANVGGETAGGGADDEGGARDYQIFAPSHPQAVNQYVREYNYYAAEEEDTSYEDQLKQYEMKVARK